jgi:hypothetical protein
MDQLTILGLAVENKEHKAQELQDIFTKYGCTIKTRLGINEIDLPGKENAGLIILELMGDKEECLRLENNLHELDQVVVRKMIF